LTAILACAYPQTDHLKFAMFDRALSRKSLLNSSVMAEGESGCSRENPWIDDMRIAVVADIQTRNQISSEGLAGVTRKAP
jgi:hypothetical protein